MFQDKHAQDSNDQAMKQSLNYEDAFPRFPNSKIPRVTNLHESERIREKVWMLQNSISDNDIESFSRIMSNSQVYSRRKGELESREKIHHSKREN
jgi:hypothetical protein